MRGFIAISVVDRKSSTVNTQEIFSTSSDNVYTYTS